MIFGHDAHDDEVATPSVVEERQAAERQGVAAPKEAVRQRSSPQAFEADDDQQGVAGGLGELCLDGISWSFEEIFGCSDE